MQCSGVRRRRVFAERAGLGRRRTAAATQPRTPRLSAGVPSRRDGVEYPASEGAPERRADGEELALAAIVAWPSEASDDRTCHDREVAVMHPDAVGVRAGAEDHLGLTYQTLIGKHAM